MVIITQLRWKANVKNIIWKEPAEGCKYFKLYIMKNDIHFGMSCNCCYVHTELYIHIFFSPIRQGPLFHVPFSVFHVCTDVCRWVDFWGWWYCFSHATVVNEGLTLSWLTGSDLLCFLSLLFQFLETLMPTLARILGTIYH